MQLYHHFPICLDGMRGITFTFTLPFCFHICCFCRLPVVLLVTVLSLHTSARLWSCCLNSCSDFFPSWQSVHYAQTRKFWHNSTRAHHIVSSVVISEGTCSRKCHIFCLNYYYFPVFHALYQRLLSEECAATSSGWLNLAQANDDVSGMKEYVAHICRLEGVAKFWLQAPVVGFSENSNMIFGLHGRRWISWPSVWVLMSEKGLYCVELSAFRDEVMGWANKHPSHYSVDQYSSVGIVNC